ncbi:MAG TPA: hypothetical protein V6C97_26890 [Oculatellaceae cyanobacterium]
MSLNKNEKQKELAQAAEYAGEQFGAYHVETGAGLIQLARYYAGSGLLDSDGISEQRVQEILQSFLSH